MKKLYKIILLLFLFIFLTTYNPSEFYNSYERGNSFFKVEKIEIVNNRLIEKNIIEVRLNSILKRNILFIKKNDLEKPLKSLDFLEKIEVKKKYPNTLIIKVYESKPIAILFKKNKNAHGIVSVTDYGFPYKMSLQMNEKSIIKPYSKYGKTKREGEKIIEKNFKNKKTKFCIGRIFSFTDKNQKKPFVIPSLVEKIKKSSDRKIIINNIDHYRDFLPTKDIALAIKILFHKNCGGIYNIGSGKKINLKNIALMIAKKNKKKIYFKKDRKTTYLISNINKIKTLGWKPRKFKKNINYFY